MPILNKSIQLYTFESTHIFKHSYTYIKIYLHTYTIHIYTKISYVYYLSICFYISIYLSVSYNNGTIKNQELISKLKCNQFDEVKFYKFSNFF